MIKATKLYETEHYAVIDCKHVADMSVNSDDVPNDLMRIWCTYYEDLMKQGYRMLHHFYDPIRNSVLCEKIPQTQHKIGEYPTVEESPRTQRRVGSKT